jgi:hypothetical protein
MFLFHRPAPHEINRFLVACGEFPLSAQARRAIGHRGGNRNCSICRKPWFEVEQLVDFKRRRLLVCDACIREMYALISGPTPATRGETR